MGTTATGPELIRDLVRGLRLALPRDRAEALRAAVAVAGVAACVAVLLFLAALPGAMGARDARLIAMTPAPVPPTAGATAQGWVVDGQFFAARWELATVDGPLRGTDLFAPDPAAVPGPPGVTSFPRPGELWVSPALAHLLADTRLSATVLDGTVVGVIGPDGLLGPDELRYYRGTATPTLPSAEGPTRSTTASGWGDRATDRSIPVADLADRPMTVLLVAGGVVAALVTAGALVLLVRVDVDHAAPSAGRGRRVDAIRGVTHALVAVVLGAVGFGVLRAAAGAIPVGSSAFFPADLSVPWAAAIFVPVAVAALLALGSTWSPRREDPEIDGHVRRRPFGAQLLVLFIAGLLLVMALPASWPLDRPRRLELSTLTVGVVAVLGAVAVLVPWLVDVVVSRRPAVAGDAREQRALSRPFGAAAGLLTAALVLQAAAGATGPGLTGSRADVVSTAATGVRAAAAGIVLLLVIGTLLFAERLGPLRWSESAKAVLLPTALGVVLAVPTAAGLVWLLEQLTDLPTSLPMLPTVGWCTGVLMVVVMVSALATGARSANPRPGPSR